MRGLRLLLNLALLAAALLVGCVAAFVFGLKVLFPASPEVHQEAMWVMAMQNGTDADELRNAREGILDLEHGFARYELAAIDAQLAVIADPAKEARALGSFCKTLAWKSCDKQQVREALKILFTKDNP